MTIDLSCVLQFRPMSRFLHLFPIQSFCIFYFVLEWNGEIDNKLAMATKDYNEKFQSSISVY